MNNSPQNTNAPGLSGPETEAFREGASAYVEAFDALGTAEGLIAQLGEGGDERFHDALLGMVQAAMNRDLDTLAFEAGRLHGCATRIAHAVSKRGAK
jgi:hypothetical protein